jgi:hypothetical protein
LHLPSSIFHLPSFHAPMLPCSHAPCSHLPSPVCSPPNPSFSRDHITLHPIPSLPLSKPSKAHNNPQPPKTSSHTSPKLTQTHPTPAQNPPTFSPSISVLRAISRPRRVVSYRKSPTLLLSTGSSLTAPFVGG